MNLLTYIQGIDNWKSLNEKLLKDDDNQIKGDVFERLTKYYLLFKPEYISLLKNVWLGSEIPDRINKKLGIPAQDQGIDLIAQTHEGEFWSIQCKYHGDNKRKISHREVSTFLSLSFSVAKGIQHAIVCTTADDYAKLYRGTENIGFVLSDEWNKLGKEFFNFVRACESKKEVKRKAPFKPFKHQKRALKNAKQHFLKENNTRGKLVFPCGAGKSLTGYWITRELKAKNIIIAVPSLALVKQTLEVYLEQSYSNYESLKWLCVCSDEGIGKADDVAVYTQDIGVPCVTDTDTIAEWLIKNKSKKTVVFTTYQSGEKIAEASRKAKMSFDLGIMDEAHKTVGASDKLFSHLLFEKNISIDKRIFMTATERRYKGSSEDILSMDDPDMYGDTFEQMTFKEAIESDILSDYKIITLFISDDEVKNLIDDNVLVKPKGSRWNAETEARTLASLIALRKAVKKYNINHSVTFHSSIAKADAFMQSQDPFTEKYTQFSAVDAFHVAGSMPTAQRSKVIDAFSSSKKAIITNARCLTEGVDVPSIDGVLFADPRKSTIDIVQAVGRALRKSKGKDFGYVILPVFTKSKTKEEVIKSDAFKDILMTLRALASNDERIIEYFRDKSSGKTSSHDSVIQFDIDEQLADVIDEQQLVEQLELSTWEKLAKISWMSYNELSRLVRGLNLKTATDYINHYRSDKFPLNVPSKPYNTYKNRGWTSWNDFLGTDNISNLEISKNYMPFKAARNFIRKLNLNSFGEWDAYRKSSLKPVTIPFNPRRAYRNDGFTSISDFVGYDNKFQDWLSYESAKKLISDMGISTQREWSELSKAKKRPINIPGNPQDYYNRTKEWKGWDDFLGKKKDYMNFKEARAYVHKLKLKNTNEWRQYYLDKSRFNPRIPKTPAYVYRNQGWIGFGDFLGSNKKSNKNRTYLEFEDARRLVHKLKLKSSREWTEYTRNKNFPENIPKSPRNIYHGKGWVSMGNWLGTGVIAPQNIEFISFSEAKKFVKKLNLRTSRDWRNYKKQGERPSFIPANPDTQYKNQWKGWADFFGHVAKEYYSYKVAKQKVKLLGIKTSRDYKSNYKRDSLFPSYPPVFYKDQWKGWDDFLGKK